MIFIWHLVLIHLFRDSNDENSFWNYKTFICLYSQKFLSAEWMIHDKYRFLIARKSFAFSAEAYLNSVYSSHWMWLMTHRLPIASNFGREISSNPARHVVSHAPASWGMCLCIKQGWSGDLRRNRGAMIFLTSTCPITCMAYPSLHKCPENWKR